MIWDDFDWFTLPKDATRDQIIKEYHIYDHLRKNRILNKTTNFRHWEDQLRGDLKDVDCAGHIFHENDKIVPIHVPIPKHLGRPEDFDARKFAFIEEEYAAIYIINLHLPKKFAIRHDDNVTAKSSYDRMAARYKRSRAKKIHEVTQEFLDVRPRDEDTSKYSLDFSMAYHKLEDVTRMFCDAKDTAFEAYMIPEGTAKLLFVQKTLHVDWFKFWRVSNKIEEMELWQLVKSLQEAHYLPASGVQKCTRCKRHNHIIEDCFKWHPERKQLILRGVRGSE